MLAMYFLDRVRGCRKTLFILMIILSVVPALSQTHFAYWAHELTAGSQIVDVYNLVNDNNQITIHIYNPNGTLRTGYPKNFTLRPYEQKTIDFANAENLTNFGAGVVGGLGLPVTGEGRSGSSTTAYGTIFSAAKSFGVIGAFDKRESGAGSGNQTYNAQQILLTDSWWGMYNYPSSDVVKQDYFHIFNAHNATNTVTIDVFDTDGVVIDANGAAPGTAKTVSMSPYQTIKVFPRADLNVPQNKQDISIHLTAPLGVAVNVSTNLGDNFNFGGNNFTSWDNVAGGWVPTQTKSCGTTCYFTNTRGSDKMAAVRVTNPNDQPTTVTWTIYPYDGTGPVGGNSYETTVTIPARGTKELKLPNVTAFKDETVSNPWFHGNRLVSTLPVAKHLSYEENIDLPVKPLKEFWYGTHDPSRTGQWILYNPNNTSIDIYVDAWYYTTTTGGSYVPSLNNILRGARGSSRPPGTSNTVTLGPYDALITNPTDANYGPVLNSLKDKIIYVHSNSEFTVQLQEPDYGDVTPLIGGYHAPWSEAIIGDRIWHDANNNGIQDAGETGIAGVTVKLFDSNGNLIAEAQSDANGFYYFFGVEPGSYYVEFSNLPAGYSFTAQNQGFDDNIDSDANPLNGQTTTFSVASGEVKRDVDAGLTQYAVIGDFVWYDQNGNGIQDNGETGFAGVTVELYDSSNNLLATTTTDANGAYSFTNVPPGNYYVKFTSPAGYEFTLQDQGGNDALDSDSNPSDGKTAVFTLSSGQTKTDVDAGLKGAASIGDFVWNDLDGDGIQDDGEPGLAGVTVNLYAADGVTLVATTTTGANGAYSFDNLPPAVYVVEFVPSVGYGFTQQDQGSDDGKDSDANPSTGRVTVDVTSGASNNTIDAGLRQLASIQGTMWQDADKDGILDDGETKLSGVTVTLYDENGAVVATTTTDGNGNYSFVDLMPGNYSVLFGRPSGSSYTLMNQGGDPTVDSDANPMTGSTMLFSLAPGENKTDLDAGVILNSGAMGDRVWYDVDNDGIQDEGEAGIGGVTVKLLNADGDVIATTVTDPNGFYYFTGLPPANYSLQFITPSGGTITTKNAGSDPGKDSDIDALGKTNVTSIGAGQLDSNWDAGYGGSPISVKLYSFKAELVGDKVLIEWQISADEAFAGFNLLRSGSETGGYARVNGELITDPTQKDNSKLTFRHYDTPMSAARWFYKIEEIGLDGAVTLHGPVSVRMTTGIAEQVMPERFELGQNYPNPFNPTTAISYSLPAATEVTLTVYDLSGRAVRTLVSGVQQAGRYTMVWDARNDFGEPVAGGVYLYRLVAGDFTKTLKMTLLK